MRWNGITRPLALIKVTGKAFEGYPKLYVEQGPHRIGKVYRKAIYREYTDETFTTLKAKPAEWTGGPGSRALFAS